MVNTLKPVQWFGETRVPGVPKGFTQVFYVQKCQFIQTVYDKWDTVKNLNII